MAVRSNCIRSREAASATTGALYGRISGRSADRLRPEVVQRRRAAAWKVRLDPGDAEPPQPRAHLPAARGGEGDRQDALRLVGAGVDAVGDPAGDGAGLAGAGAGEDAHRAHRVARDLALLRVERGEDLVGAGTPLWWRARRPRS